MRGLRPGVWIMTWTPTIYYYCPYCGRSHSDPDAACCGEKGHCTVLSGTDREFFSMVLAECRRRDDEKKGLFLCNVVRGMDFGDEEKQHLIATLWNYSHLACPEVMAKMEPHKAWLSHIAGKWELPNDSNAFRLEWLQQMVDGTLPEDMQAALTDRKEYLK